MSKLLIPTLAITALTALPSIAEVDPKIHKLCIEAKDYAGCVRAMRGDTSAETTVRQIQQQGASITEGNACPAQYLYAGGGYCQRAHCTKGGLFGKGHDEQLAGKGYSCPPGDELHWTRDQPPVRASVDNNCPNIKLEIGYMSTCHMPKWRKPKIKSSNLNLDNIPDWGAAFD